MRNVCLLLAMLTMACDTSHQSVNVDKSAERVSVQQSGDGNGQTMTIRGADGSVSATQTDTLSATSQTVNAENVEGKLSVSQTSAG